MPEISSKLTIKAPEQVHGCRYAVFVVNFELVKQFALVLLFLTFNKYIWLGKNVLKQQETNN